MQTGALAVGDNQFSKIIHRLPCRVDDRLRTWAPREAIPISLLLTESIPRDALEIFKHK